MTETIRVIREGTLTRILLSRPEVYNAFDLPMVELFKNHLITLGADSSVRAIVITGEGKSFCTGADVKWAYHFPQGLPVALHVAAGHLHQAVLEIRRMNKPVIAAINGTAAGGGFSLALACDFRVMAKSSVLRQAYTSNGLCIDGGGSFALPRLVGLARALEIAAFDQPISAEKALAWGLITKIAEDGHALEEAENMARELEKISLYSFGWSKRLLTDSFNTSFETHIEWERTGLRSCAEHGHGKEGVEAFISKRKPVFN